MKMKDPKENDEHYGNLYEIRQDLEKLKEYIERIKASEVGVQPEVIKTNGGLTEKEARIAENKWWYEKFNNFQINLSPYNLGIFKSRISELEKM